MAPGNKAMDVLQTGLTGSTGCVLSYDHVYSVMPGFGIDERIYILATEFAAQSNGSIHREGREERKAQPQKSLNSEEIIRTGTQITRIGRIYTDPCASLFSKFILREQIENHENYSN
jgi:hypothetical protein